MAKKTNPTNPEPDIKRERYTTSLSVELTPDEVADRADRAAKMMKDRDDKEAEMKAQTKHQKGIIEEIDAEMRRLQSEVRTRSTYAPVDCDRVYNFTEKTYTEVRLDTDAELSRRRLTHAELQRELPFTAPPDEAAGDDEPGE